MRTFKEAQAVALSRIALLESEAGPLSLVEAATLEFSEGWVFHYQSTRYLETQNSDDAIAGNAPLFVPRNGERASFISYHRPVAESIAAFAACGNANAKPTAEVCLAAWGVGAQVVSAVLAIREHSELGLGTAKAAVEQCLGGARVPLSTRSIASAHELAAALSRVGFTAEVTYADKAV